ncbi:hypothetical protein [Photobacterium chitinilyticum]|uniref:Uncharacterized protein n=1 Tax=Photobacterium chitinilyticum TaxID=2485123 RepID=A0A3S3SYD0_9GAMM|nr:hypothetical protein [Photobacterium chitinilyticum]RWX54906.1 hypothetical protein EDI28_14275 [Photobacterium chitinilyticum]
MKLYSSLFFTFFVSACTSQEAVTDVAGQKTTFIQGECYDPSTYSLTETFDHFIDERQQELKILRPELTAENYEQLDYALRHFTTYWTQLRQERDQACEEHASCEFIKLKTHDVQVYNRGYCDGTDFEYNVSRAKMINFFNDIERLQLQRSAQQ